MDIVCRGRREVDRRQLWCMRWTGSRGWSRSPPKRNVDYQSIINRLTAGKVSINRLAHVLVGSQLSLPLVLAGHNPQSQIWRIELSTQRVGVFPQDHVSHVVDHIVFIYRDERRRRTGPPYPYLPPPGHGRAGQTLQWSATEVLKLIRVGGTQKCTKKLSGYLSLHSGLGR